MSKESRKKREAWAENGLEDWGSYMAAKKAKLEDQFQEQAKDDFNDATNIFKGIAIFVNGYTNPCADVLKRLMMEHGGVYHHYLRSQTTTHLIASNLPYTKIVQYRKNKNPLPLCKPEWITDSIKAKKLLDWRPYLLYSSATEIQPQLQFNSNEKSSTAFVTHNTDSNQHMESISNKNIKNVISLDDETKEHQEILINKGENKTNKQALSSKDAEFISEFYNNSRLHHIATMAATFKEYVNELRLKNTGLYPGLERLKSSSKNFEIIHDKSDESDQDILEPKTSNNMSSKKQTIIMHIDMDCFFVSVGLKNHNELRGQPVAVTHSKGNKPQNKTKEDQDFVCMSEIASCSYEARKYGIKNGMFLGQALKLCPNLKTIEYDFEGYKDVSYALYNTVASYTLDIEAVSCDEMYADITELLKQCNLLPDEFAKIIREEIKNKTQCPVSTGFGSNKLQARLATKKAKPDGFFYLKSKDVESYIEKINIRDFPGVGSSTMHQLQKMNVKTCMDLKTFSMGALQKEFGKKNGEMLYNTCRGIDNSKLDLEHIRKSVSTEVNYGIRFGNDNDAKDFLTKLSKEIHERLIKINAKGRCLTLKIMVRAKGASKNPAKFMGHGVCDNFTKSTNFMMPIDDEIMITREVLKLWEKMHQPADEIRGVGIHISKLETAKINIMNTNMNKFMAKEKYNKEKTKEQPALTINLNSTPEKKLLLKDNNDGILLPKQEQKVNKLQGLKAFFVTKKKSKTKTPKEQSHFPDHSKIDQSVFAELPQDIKEEILQFYGSSSAANYDNQTIQNTSQAPTTTIKLNKEQKSISENRKEFSEEIQNEILAEQPMLKKSHPGILFEPKMPSMLEIDMQVLVELPDNIRNEILNNYKKNIMQPAENIKSRSRVHDQEILNKKVENIFAYDKEERSEDIRSDAKMYCMNREKKKELPSKKVSDKETRTKINVHKRLKLNQEKSCHKKKNIVNFSERNDSFLEHNLSILTKDTATKIDKRDAIRLHNLSFHDNKMESDCHQEMLMTLVNHLFSLSLQQVKKQMRTWILRSGNVNEIDLLSIETFLSMLPKEKRIGDLHASIKTMHRCMMETGSCVWHGIYRKTVQRVQHYMLIEYNSKLLLPSIRCDLCEQSSLGTEKNRDIENTSYQNMRICL